MAMGPVRILVCIRPAQQPEPFEIRVMVTTHAHLLLTREVLGTSHHRAMQTTLVILQDRRHQMGRGRSALFYLAAATAKASATTQISSQFQRYASHQHR